MKKVRVAVSGGAGGICYSLLFKIAAGELFGFDTLIDLMILEVPQSMKMLGGVVMELKDCAYPLLSSITTTDSADKAFDGAEYVFLVGARPRSQGMERSDLLGENGKIFVAQGKALNQSPRAKILVVGNPCNTNALILKNAAHEISDKNIRAMTRLDQNRATAMLADKANVPVGEVKGVVIFGNHSSTMVIDYLHATIGGKPAEKVIDDLPWLQDVMFPSVQQRGRAVLEARGLSSAASAASAAIDSMKDWIYPTDTITCASIYSKGNPYGIDEDLYFSFPIKNEKIVQGLKMDAFLREKIKLTEKELIEEREMIRKYLR